MSIRVLANVNIISDSFNYYFYKNSKHPDVGRYVIKFISALATVHNMALKWASAYIIMLQLKKNRSNKCCVSD